MWEENPELRWRQKRWKECFWKAMMAGQFQEPSPEYGDLVEEMGLFGIGIYFQEGKYTARDLRTIADAMDKASTVIAKYEAEGTF